MSMTIHPESGRIGTRSRRAVPRSALIRAACAALLMCLVAHSAFAGEARERLDRFADRLTTASAQFDQQVLDANGRVADRSSGTVALRAPRQFRWEYLLPYRQSLVADGTHVWIHDVDLEQVTVRNQSHEEQHSPLAVLIDPGLIDQEFKLEELGQEDGIVWLRLRSRGKEPEFEHADLGFDEQGLAQLRIRDTLGQLSVLEFRHWKRNVNLPESWFSFTPPEGVDVIGETQPEVEVFPID